jgi:Zn-dependent peptidase ImmA (M78 family)
MVAWVPDRSGRFPKRPHYTQQELDRECESIVGRFLREKYGKVEYPLTTNDLTILVESFCSDLDQYADLSAEGADVEGMTEFFPDIAPKIYISERIATDERRENRLRTTLSHELGHAHFHRLLFAELFAPGALFSRRPSEAKMVCKRDNMLGAKEVDWMEWQAGYASGAFLMPASALRRYLSAFCSSRGLHTAIPVESPDSRDMQQAVMEGFQVSADAARVRLLKLGFLTNQPGPPSLFG